MRAKDQGLRTHPPQCKPARRFSSLLRLLLRGGFSDRAAVARNRASTLLLALRD